MTEEPFVSLNRYLPKVLIDIIHEYHPSISCILRTLIEPKDYQKFLFFLQRLFYAKYVPDIQYYLLVGYDADELWEAINECRILQQDMTHDIMCGNEYGFGYPTSYIINCHDGYNVRPGYRIRDDLLIYSPNPCKTKYTVFGYLNVDSGYDKVTIIEIRETSDEDLIEKVSRYLFTERVLELKKFLLHIQDI